MSVGNHTLPTGILQTCGDGFLYCYAKWAHDVTTGFFWVAILMGFMAVLFMGTQRFGTARSFGFASVSGLFGSMWLATLRLMPWWVASLFILVGGAGFVVMILNER